MTTVTLRREDWERMREALNHLCSVVNTVNYGKHHEMNVPDDDEPVIPQRKEWVEYLLEENDKAFKALSIKPVEEECGEDETEGKIPLKDLEEIEVFIGNNFVKCEFTGCDTKDCKTQFMQSWTLLSGEGEADRYRCSLCALKEITSYAVQDAWIDAQERFKPSPVKSEEKCQHSWGKSVKHNYQIRCMNCDCPKPEEKP